MDIEELPAEAVRALYTCVSVPNTHGESREALRAANAGLHVEVPSRRGVESPERVLAMDEAPASPSRRSGPVITLTFGAPAR